MSKARIREPAVECAGSGALASIQSQRLRACLPTFLKIPQYRAILERAGLGQRTLSRTLADKDLLRRFRTVGFTDGSTYVAIDRHALLELDRRLFYIESTSGTTDSPKSRYVTAEDDVLDKRMLLRAFVACGVGPRDRVLALELGDSDLYALFANALAAIGVSDTVFYSAFHPFDRSIADALRFKPTVLIAIPSMLLRGRTGLFRALHDNPQLKTLIYTAEPLDDDLKSYLRDKHRIESFSLFGTVECGMIGSECCAHDGIHVWTDSVFMTLKNARPASNVLFNHSTRPVHEGMLAITTLMHVGKPTLAYLTGDIVQYSDGKCSCGRMLPRIRFVARARDTFSILGTKLSYAEVQRWLRQSGADVAFFALRLDRVANRDRLSVLLPRSRQMGPSQKDDVVMALCRHPALEFLLEHRVLTVHGELVPLGQFTKRKLPKVTDLRSVHEHRRRLSRTLR